MVAIRRSSRGLVKLASSSGSGSRSKTLRRSMSPISEESPPVAPNGSVSDIDTVNSPHSPFFLHSADHPGLSLVADKLDGTNYNHWSAAMKIALDAKNKLGFINGSLPRPEAGTPMFQIWSRCNSMVKSWMLNAVSKQIYGSILNFDDATMIWKDLHNRFHMTNLPRTFHLIQQIQDLRQGSMDLSSYYTALKTLWDQLDGSEPSESCLCCHSFNCASKKNFQAKLDRSRLIKFLSGLNESYSIIRGQIIMKKPLPDISEVYNILDQDDSQRQFGNSVVPAAFQVGNVGAHPGVVNATVSSTSAGSFNAAYQKDKPLCSHCGRTGHVVDRCYKLHGYPPGWKPRKPYSTSQSSQVSQHNPPLVAAQVTAQVSPTEKQSNGLENLIGNLSKEQIQSFVAYFNAHLVPQSSAQPTQIIHTPSANDASSSGIEFSNSTFKFIGILTVTQSVTNKRSWIIDSGATHHVSHDKSLFVDLDESVHQYVNLPNGNMVVVAGVGTVVLNGSIRLKNVLYIPEFRLNLLSISSLTVDLGSRVVFDPVSCLIQDLSKELTIGRGRRIANLYILDVEEPADSRQLSSCSLNAVIDSAVWHKRLGHTSFSRIGILTDVLGIAKQRNKFIM